MRADSELMSRLQKREHYFRNASEGEYDANLMMKARFEIETLREALRKIERLADDTTGEGWAARIASDALKSS